MEATIPTQEQLADMKNSTRRTKWGELYDALELHGALIVPSTDGSKRQCYDHFKKLGKRVRWKYNRKDNTYGIWLDGDFIINDRRKLNLDSSK